MADKTRTVGSRKSHQSLERSAGTPEPANPGSHYQVAPGETHPEFFPDTLKGQSDAISRAAWLSVGHSPQRVLVTRAAARHRLPACQDKVIRRFRNGQEIWSAASSQPDPEPGVVLDLRGI
jgi:hypothetical protein